VPAKTQTSHPARAPVESSASSLRLAVIALTVFTTFSHGQEKPAASSAIPATATKEAPFENTLGMRFVPVPIVGGPTAGQRILFSVWEVRVRDYAAFIKDTAREWPPPRSAFDQGPTHPAVMVTWEDAHAFCRWLTERERIAGRIADAEVYRVPSDHEWSCAVGIGDREDPAEAGWKKGRKLKDVFPWGTEWPPPPGVGNYRGAETLKAGQEADFRFVPGYRDAFTHTAPVGSYPANRHGLFDLGGNVTEWCQDLQSSSHSLRIFRGGAFHLGQDFELISSARLGAPPETRNSTTGFRPVIAVVK
jgi:formylglycine-generating enzyme required for sulfatase activity